MAFIEAVAKATGRKQRIPEHWLDHPVFGPQFRLPPSVLTRPRPVEKPAAKKAAKKAVEPKADES